MEVSYTEGVRGNCCFNLSTGANRSPSFLNLAKAAFGSKNKLSGADRRTAFFTSSHLIGIETNGRSRLARSE